MEGRYKACLLGSEPQSPVACAQQQNLTNQINTSICISLTLVSHQKAAANWAHYRELFGLSLQDVPGVD